MEDKTRQGEFSTDWSAGGDAIPRTLSTRRIHFNSPTSVPRLPPDETLRPSRSTAQYIPNGYRRDRAAPNIRRCTEQHRTLARQDPVSLGQAIRLGEGDL